MSAQRLLVAGSLLLLANVITFGLANWQINSGGPDGRLREPSPYPNFQFPQTGIEGIAPPGWQPRFPCHLYVSFTSVVAFSPTDTLPLTVRAKALMAVQAMIVLVVVLARVINILPS